MNATERTYTPVVIFMDDSIKHLPSVSCRGSAMAAAESEADLLDAAAGSQIVKAVGVQNDFAERVA